MTLPRAFRALAAGLALFLPVHGAMVQDDGPVRLTPRKPSEPDPFARAIIVEDEVRVVPYFVPDAHTPLNPLLYRIGMAQKSIRVQAYGFTSRPIADALIDAHKRGVDVRIILDRSNATDMHSQGENCRKAGIAVMQDNSHAIAHLKVMVFDGNETATGSMNYTDSGVAKNAENVVFIHSPGVAKQYLDNWDAHAAHAKPFGPTP